MNKTAYITHPVYLKHDTGRGHPESPERLTALEKGLKKSDLWGKLLQYEGPIVSREDLVRAHDVNYLDSIENSAPTTQSEVVYLDRDTRISFHSLEAAQRASGAVVLATDLVLDGQVDNAFCAVRPPGHHAKRNRSMGFCVYNHAMVGIYHALSRGIHRVALLDFDVHHGNGSEQIIADDERVLFCSTFQYPYYPHEPFKNNGHIICSPLPSGAGSQEFRDEVNHRWIPALEQFKPEIIFISAGFDAHADDSLADLNLKTEDYQWVTSKIMEIANQYAFGRIVSILEGGYNTHILSETVQVHVRTLLGIE